MFRCKGCGALNRVGTGAKGTPVCGRCKAPLDVSGAPQDVGSAELARAVSSATVPVLVDFWAPWCGPCKATAPIIESFARETPGTLITLKLNTDENPEAANAHGIQGIPTFIIFKDGSVIGRRSGALPKHALESWVGQVVAASSSAGSA
jgi:thioredoxin 2